MEHIKRNLSIGFGLSLVILLLSTAASYISITNLVNNLRQVNHTNLVISELESIMSTLKDAETGQRGYLLSGEEEFLEPYNDASHKILGTFARIKELTRDDTLQSRNALQLRNVVFERIIHLRNSIALKKANNSLNIAQLREGKQKMDEARSIVKQMEDREKLHLVPRAKRLRLFAAYTPVVIIVAAVLALLITLTFYTRVRRDFDIRSRLQLRLKTNEQEIKKRINIIQEIATRISLGDYKVRINDEEQDALGGLAESLNKMAESLQYSFDLLMEKEWMQTGIAELNEKMIDETDIHALCRNTIKFITSYINAQVGTMYLLEHEEELTLTGAYGFVDDGTRSVIKLGEGLVGQCALSGEQKILREIEESSIVINFAAGQIRPRNIIAAPIFYERKLKGVVELATVFEISNKELSFLTAVAKDIGIGINSVQNRVRLRLLLQETQLQKEELHTQHADLQSVNAELEVNTSTLQASEELLKIQQEELVESNRELEARTLLLEERNKTILERNVEIQAKGELLKQSNQYKSEFLTNMSHELRTPLNSILLLSGLMVDNKDNKLSEEHIEFAKVIQNSGKGLLTLIDEILDLSKIESGKMELYYESIEVGDIVQNMAGLFKEVAHQKSIEFIIDVAPEVPLNIETDQMRLEQILKNLVSNALKFTPEGGRVELSVFKSPGEIDLVSFTVKDTGIGISKEKQELIFEAFQQADGSTQRRYGGTGLGLSISRQLVKLLGGTIKLESEIDKGSEFIISIPYRKPGYNDPLVQGVISTENFQAGKQHPEPENRKAIDDSTKEPTAWEEMKADTCDTCILIIESDVVLAKDLNRLITGYGWKGILASNVMEGLDLAKKEKPAGVLIDMEASNHNAWQLMTELKKDMETRHIPLHILSANGSNGASIQQDVAPFTNKLVSFEKVKDNFKSNQNKGRQKKKILIVEEDEKNAQILAGHLRKTNLKIDCKNNVAEAIRALFNIELDCVILCLDVAAESSFESIERVRKTVGLEDLPIMIFDGQNSSKGMEYSLRQYLQAVSSKDGHHWHEQVLDEVLLFLQVVSQMQPGSSSGSTFMDLGNVLKDKTVLIVDDDIRNIFSITKTLEAHKMRVLSALEGKEALMLLEANPGVDLILMDMMMPEMDGYETTIRIMKDPKVNHIPIIALTARSNAGDREKCVEAGARDYITKPVDVDRLLSLLHIWLYEIHINKTKRSQEAVVITQ